MCLNWFMELLPIKVELFLCRLWCFRNWGIILNEKKSNLKLFWSGNQSLLIHFFLPTCSSLSNNKLIIPVPHKCFGQCPNKLRLRPFTHNMLHKRTFNSNLRQHNKLHIPDTNKSHLQQIPFTFTWKSDNLLD